MTQVFENQLFRRLHDRNSRSVFSDIEFRKCRFDNCDISITDDPRLRSTVRHVRLIDCEYYETGGLSAAIIEEALVDGLRIHGLLQTWGMVFKHVTLRGRIGRMMLSNNIAPVITTQATQRAFAEANAAYYGNVDWALDISEAEFQELSFRGIPGRLVRRDRETQVVVTRQKAMRGEWRGLDLERTYWQVAIELMLERGDEDVVLVAPKRAKEFNHLLRGIQLLRDAGVAEPD